MKGIEIFIKDLSIRCPARHFRNNYFEFKASPTRFSIRSGGPKETSGCPLYI